MLQVHGAGTLDLWFTVQHLKQPTLLSLAGHMRWLVLNMGSSTWYIEVAISSSVLFILKAHSLHTSMVTMHAVQYLTFQCRQVN